MRPALMPHLSFTERQVKKRGGYRPGAGRKPKANLTYRQQLTVGATFNAMMERIAKRRAWAKHRQSTIKREIRANRETEDDGVINIEELDTMLRFDDRDVVYGTAIKAKFAGARYIALGTISLKRAYGAKDRARKVTIIWCRHKYKQTITPSKADECRREFARLMKRARAETV
jgi:hypothetical protein